MAYMFQFGRTDVFLATLLPTSSLKWKIIAQPVWNPWHCAALRIVCSHRIFHLSVMQTSKVSGLRWGVLPNVADLTGRIMGFHQWIWHKGYWLSSNTGITPCYCSCQRKMILDHLNHSKKKSGFHILRQIHIENRGIWSLLHWEPYGWSIIPWIYSLSQ